MDVSKRRKLRKSKAGPGCDWGFGKTLSSLSGHFKPSMTWSPPDSLASLFTIGPSHQVQSMLHYFLVLNNRSLHSLPPHRPSLTSFLPLNALLYVLSRIWHVPIFQDLVQAPLHLWSHSWFSYRRWPLPALAWPTIPPTDCHSSYLFTICLYVCFLLPGWAPWSRHCVL